MTADDLDLRVEKPFPGEMGQELVAEKTLINSLLNTGLPGLPLDNLSNPPGGELILPVGIKTTAVKSSFGEENRLEWISSHSERS